MAVLRNKEILKMDKENRVSKLRDLKLELVKSNVTANKSKAKTKEIKRAIARLMTFETKEAEKHKVSKKE